MAFLTWALPRLGLSWPGFRRVRRQVCKRIARRLAELRLGDAAAYRAYIECHPEEWQLLDELCRITISRFYRDAPVFEYLERAVLPQLAEAAVVRGAHELACWSAGCASGEEPYSLSILWKLALAPRFPGLSLRILATDIDPHLLERAVAGRYRAGSLRELPAAWRREAFAREGADFVLREEFRKGVTYQQHDVRHEPPRGPFDLVLCRYLALTYFDEPLQRQTLQRIVGELRPGGALVVGLRERLPDGVAGLAPWEAALGVYQRVPPARLEAGDRRAARTALSPAPETPAAPEPGAENVCVDARADPARERETSPALETGEENGR